MTPELRPITKLTLTSVAALFLLATPLAIDWDGFDVDASHAKAEGDKDGRKGGSDSSDGLGGAVDAVGDAVGAVADGASDAVDGSDSSDSSGDSAADGSGSDSGSGESDSSGEADSGGETDSSGASESDSDSATGDDGDGSAIGDAADAVDGSVSDDDATVSENDSGAESDETSETSDASVAPDPADAASPTTDTAVVDDATSPSPPSAEAEAAPDLSTGEAIATPTPSRGKAAVGSPRVTVAVITIPPSRAHGDRSDKRRSAAGTATVDLLGDASPSGLAAIEPSAGPILANPAPPAPTASTGCTTDDGQEQGTQISCLVAGSKTEVQPRQVAYVPPEATIGRRAAADRPTEGQIAPTIAGLPRDPGLYDEIYGLQQVEARRYADGDVPVLIVQGIVSNMSNGQRSVPPLLAIVQDERGKELLRWTFRAEAETLGPGGSTGFRSEMFDPQSESAKVTIVFAAEQQATP